MKHSLRKRLVIIFIAIVATTLVIIGLLNYFFMDDFYLMQKRNAMIEVYKEAAEDFRDNYALDDDCRSNNITYIMFLSSFNFAEYKVSHAKKRSR